MNEKELNPSHEFGIFPWVTFTEAFDLFGFRVLHWKVGVGSPDIDPSLHADLNAIALMYRRLDGNPLNGVTLVIPLNGPNLPRLSAEQRARLAAVRSVVALCALATRRYFESTYVNSAQFSLYCQSFDPGTAVWAGVRRRRDGTSFSTWARSKVRVSAPAHVLPAVISVRHPANPMTDPSLDSDLRDLLVNVLARGDSHARRLLVSIDTFLVGNADDELVRERDELLLMQQALEHLLAAEAKAKQFAMAFQKILGIAGAVSPYAASRRWRQRDMSLPYPRDGKVPSPDFSILGLWAYEFYQLRNDLVHGNDPSTRAWCWSLQEHLLFASWIYPELVRARCRGLQSDGAQGVSNELVNLASARLDTPNWDNDAHGGQAGWVAAEWDASIRRISVEVEAEFRKFLQTERGQGVGAPPNGTPE